MLCAGKEATTALTNIDDELRNDDVLSSQAIRIRIVGLCVLSLYDNDVHVGIVAT